MTANLTYCVNCQGSGPAVVCAICGIEEVSCPWCHEQWHIFLINRNN